jgi:hypothetical protein
MNIGQKTPCGHTDFNSYVKILRVFIDNGQTNGQTDRQTDGQRHTLAACGLEELFFHCLRKVPPAHAPWV